MSFSLFTSVANDAANVMSAIAADPLAQTLATDLEAAWNEPDPLSDPTVQNDLAAIEQDVNAGPLFGAAGLASAYVCGLGPSGPPPSPQPIYGVSLNMLDTQFISTTVSPGYTLSFQVKSGCATGWLVSINQLLDTSAVDPGSIVPVYEQDGQLGSPGPLPLLNGGFSPLPIWVEGNSLWKKVETSALIDRAANFIFNLSSSSPNATISLPVVQGQEDAYSLRFYSGGTADPDELKSDIQGTQNGDLSNASTLSQGALALNYLDAALNYVETVIPVDVIGCVANTSIFNLAVEHVQNLVSQQPTPSPQGLADAIATVATDIGASFQGASANCVSDRGTAAPSGFDLALQLLEEDAKSSAKAVSNAFLVYNASLDTANLSQLSNELAFVASPVDTMIAIVNPSLTISPAGVNFGSQQVGAASNPQAVTIQNNGQSPVTIESIVTVGGHSGDFATDSGCLGSLAANSNCTLHVTFKPSATGQRNATLAITNNASGNPLAVALTGNGLAGSLANLSSSALSFPSQAVDTVSSPQPIALTNTGQTALNITGISVTGTNASDFRESDNCNVQAIVGATLQAGASCVISVSFEPAGTGSRSAMLQITDSAPGSPQQATLNGTGTLGSPQASLSPSTLNFGTQGVGSTSGPQTAILTNNGNAPLSITGIGVAGTNAGDFLESDNCSVLPLVGGTLQPGGSCILNVTFNPTVTGSRTATLNMTDNAPASPQTVSLSGTGTVNPNTQPAIASVSPNPLTGSSSAQPFTINGSGFTSSSTVTLRDITAGQTFTNRPISSQTAIQIVINPIFTTAAHTWTVEVLNGTLSSGQFTFQVIAPPGQPSISGVSPTSYAGSNNNQTMTINGSNFQSGATLTFVPPEGGSIASTASKLTFVSSSQLSYQFNDGSDAGTWSVTVNNPGGQVSNSVSFTVTAGAPVISGVSPTSYAGSNNNQTMTINGSNFQSGATLTFVPPEGGTIASTASKLTFVSSSQLSYQFNDGSDAGTWSVTVDNPGGQVSNSVSFTVTAAAPVISGVSPTSYAGSNNNQTMTINGSNFQSGATLTFVPPEGGTHCQHRQQAHLRFQQPAQLPVQRRQRCGHLERHRRQPGRAGLELGELHGDGGGAGDQRGVADLVCGLQQQPDDDHQRQQLPERCDADLRAPRGRQHCQHRQQAHLRFQQPAQLPVQRRQRCGHLERHRRQPGRAGLELGELHGDGGGAGDQRGVAHLVCGLE